MELSLEEKLNQIVFEKLNEIITPNKQEMFDRVAKERTKHLTIVLENIHQEHNASAVLRTCDCFGIQDLHVIEKNNTYKVQRDIALGAGRWVDMHIYDEPINPTLQCLTKLKTDGYAIVATTPHTNQFTPENIDLSKPIALVFGTEREGISEEVKTQADAFLAIPMYGFTESFNISVCAAMLIHTLRMRMEKELENWKLSSAEQTKVKIEWCKKIIHLGEQLEERLRKESVLEFSNID
jgi:tRNA (guanosine-2'-O-)-methyltransferase